MSLTSKSFKDFSLTFEKNAVTNDILALKNEAAIKEAVKNIVLYNFYEKPFNPFFGGNIIGLLFENSTPTMELEVKNRICLLYTSPSPRDKRQSRMPSSA